MMDRLNVDKKWPTENIYLIQCHWIFKILFISCCCSSCEKSLWTGACSSLKLAFIRTDILASQWKIKLVYINQINTTCKIILNLIVYVEKKNTKKNKQRSTHSFESIHLNLWVWIEKKRSWKQFATWFVFLRYQHDHLRHALCRLYA